MLRTEKPAAFMACSETYASLLRSCTNGHGHPSPRLWLISGGDLPRGRPAEPSRLPELHARTPHPSAWLIELYGAGGNATVIALRPEPPSLTWPGRFRGLVIPPNRVRIVDGSGRRVKRGEEGDLMISGPAVTQGYWNAIEETLAAKDNGWLHTGIRARRTRLPHIIGADL